MEAPHTTYPDYPDRLRDFAAAMRDDADRLDSDGTLLGEWYGRFVGTNLHTGWSPRQPLSGREFCEALAILAETSGAFGFVALQQFVANANLAGKVSDRDSWPIAGVAFGHLRNPSGPAPRWDGHSVDGMVPWMTGAGLFPQVVLGMRGPGNEEIYALADATDRDSFRHSAPMDLIAGSGMRTVSVRLSGMPMTADTVLKTEPPGTMQRNDVQGVLYQTPLMVGCVRASRALIRVSPRVGSAERARCEAETERLLQRVYTAFEGCTPEEGQQLRAELGDLSVRLGRLAVMASGGVGILRSHHAQRLYREALLYSVMAQTDAIVNQAFQEVFP
jgi:hypothetical protein